MKQLMALEEQGTDLRGEGIGGLTTFLSMAYILFVNSAILADAGMDRDAVFVATGLAAAIGTLVMGLWARYPIALAPGMGLNAFFAYTVVLTMGIPWQTALAGTLVSGVLFFVLAVTGFRGMIINAIPAQLKLATGAGIGLFIAFIGLRNAGIIVGDDATFVALGSLGAPATLLAVFGIVVTALLLIRGIKGAVFYGMVLTALAGMVAGVVPLPERIVGAVPSLAPTFGQAITNLPEIFTLDMAVVIFSFLFVDFFDTAGTLIAVAHQGGFMKEGQLPRANRALASDSIATMAGAVLGTSTTTSYIESSTGIAAGARTGLASVVVAALFLLSLFFSPLLGVVTASVTAPALVIVGVLMASGLGDIDWKDLTIAIPAFVTVVAMPLTFSIATGIALGLVLYPLMKLFKGEYRAVHPVMWSLFVVFLAYFVFVVE